MRHLRKSILFPLFYLLTTSAFGQPCISLSSAPGTDDQTVCINTPIIQITYSLTPFITGVTVFGLPDGVTGEFKPGVYAITGTPTVSGNFVYNITTTGICLGGGDIASGKITVNPLPLVTFPGILTPQCINSTTYTLTGGSPVGGTYSGDGVTGTNFDASVAGLGNHIITYSYTDSNGCSNAATNSITVNSIPVPTLSSSDPDNIFCSGTSITFTAGGGQTYNFRVNNSSVQDGISNTYTTSSLINGQFVDVIVTNLSGCSATSTTITNMVNPVPVATASNNGPVCPGTQLSLTGGPGGMIAYSWSGPNNFSSALQNPIVNLSATAAMAGLYSLTVTNGFACQNTASTNVIVRALPVVIASNNGPVCVGSPLSLTGGPVGMAGYSWTGPNGFTSVERSPQVSASATMAMAGSYFLTVTDNFACQNIAGTVVIVNTSPVATASNNGPVCLGTPLTLAGGPSGMSSYLWTGPNGYTSNAQNPTVSASATFAMAGSYILTVTNATSGCFSTASTSVVVNPVPVALPTNNGPVCEGALLTLTGAPAGMTYSWTGPNGFVSVQQNPVVSGSATAAMAGIYTLTITSANGCQGSATTSVTINPLPVATATNNGPVCANSPLILAGGPSGMISYSWVGPNGFVSTLQSPTVSLTSTVAMAGVYTLTVINNNGCRNTITTTAIINALPVPAAANNGPVCAGTPLTLTGGPAGMASYSWTGPAGFVSPDPSPVVSPMATTAMTGAYTLTIVNSAGCQNSAVTTAVVNTAPVATASNNGPVCVGTPLSLTGGPAGMASYSWSGPNLFTSTQPSPVVSSSSTLAMAGVYLLTVTSLSGCQDTASTRAGVFAVPVSNAGPGGVECDLNFVLNAVPSVGAGLWSVVTGPGTATFAPAVTSPVSTVTVSVYGTYTFRWTETNGPCISSSIVTVNFYQPPIINAGPGGDACDLDFIFNAVPSAGIGTWTMINGTGTATFNPGASSPTATVVVSEYGTKIFKWKEANGICADSATITVNFYQQPFANAGTGGNICGLGFNFNATPSIGTGTWTRESGPGTVAFTPNANLPDARVTVTAFGTHVFRWTEVNGTCSSGATVSVTFIQQPVANGGAGGDKCGLSFGLNAVPASGTQTWTKVNGPGNVVFTPNASSPNATATVTQFGQYDFAWTVVNSICSSTDVVRVIYHDVPPVSAGADAVICRGRNIQLNAAGVGTFQWVPANLVNNPSIPNPLATPTVTTLFTVTLTDRWGCKNTDQVNVDVKIQPVANAGPDQELSFLFETSLNATAPVDGQTGEWTLLAGGGDISDINDPVTQVSDLLLEANSFIWTVTNQVCPVSGDTVTVFVRDLIIPTLITPNLDGRNDFFVINGLETLGKSTLTIFNRLGGRVYEKENYTNNWNGVDDNENDLPEDTYFYILKTEKSRTLKGYVVIRR